jgi:predicted transcriptional regulator of viral defense system
MAKSAASPPSSLAQYVDRLQGSGRYTFTRREAERDTRVKGASLEAALRRLRANHRIVTPRRGFHVIVPVEYRAAGAPPPPWFVDDLMRFLGQPYYVGLASAAALHGAAHQQPMVFQLITDRPTRPVRVGRARIAFHMARNVEQIPVTQSPTDTGSIRVSTPVATAFDLVRFASAAGHLDNVATILGELAGQLTPAALAAAAPLHAVSDVQRLGYLLELVGGGQPEALARWLGTHRVRPVVLARGVKPGRARPDDRWRVIPNVKVEADT